MLNLRSTILAAGLVLASAIAASPANAAVQAGVLSCRSGPSVGMIVGSMRRFSCVFRPSNPRLRPQFYNATVGRVGLDLGFTTASRLGWAVFAPTAMIGPGDLAGRYIGGSASVALGLGAGANALVGGSRNSVALQPLSLEGQIGLNVALGAEGLTLRPGR